MQKTDEFVEGKPPKNAKEHVVNVDV